MFELGWKRFSLVEIGFKNISSQILLRKCPWAIQFIHITISLLRRVLCASILKISVIKKTNWPHGDDVQQKWYSRFRYPLSTLRWQGTAWKRRNGCSYLKLATSSDMTMVDTIWSLQWIMLHEPQTSFFWK